MKKLALYMLRWQMSTPILALIPMAFGYYFGITDFWVVAVAANFIGSTIFYWVDKRIFKNQ